MIVDMDLTGESIRIKDDPEADKMWHFGVTIWKIPGVKERCLAWQVDFGFDVSFLVFLAWVSLIRGEILNKDDVRRANEHVREWRQTVIEPARRSRKYVKALITDGAPELTAAFRHLRGVELMGELREQRLLLTWLRNREKAKRAGEGAFLGAVKDYVCSIRPTLSTSEEQEMGEMCKAVIASQSRSRAI